MFIKYTRKAQSNNNTLKTTSKKDASSNLKNTLYENYDEEKLEFNFFATNILVY